MNQNNPKPIGHTRQQKEEYYEKYLKRVPIRYQRCIGVTEDMLCDIKTVVQLATLRPSTVRSFVTAILEAHLKEYKFVYEYFRREMYNQVDVSDRLFCQSAAADYMDKYCKPSEDSRGSAWLHVDAGCVETLSLLVKWLGNGCTIGSVAEAIIKEHLTKYQDLIEEMKSDMYKILSI